MPQHDDLAFLHLPRPNAQGDQLKKPTEQKNDTTACASVANLRPNSTQKRQRIGDGHQADRTEIRVGVPSCDLARFSWSREDPSRFSVGAPTIAGESGDLGTKLEVSN